MNKTGNVFVYIVLSFYLEQGSRRTNSFWLCEVLWENQMDNMVDWGDDIIGRIATECFLSADLEFGNRYSWNS